MCDTVFTLQSLLNTHFDQHIINHKVPVFKCPDCSTLYAQKQLLIDHIKVGHNGAVLFHSHGHLANGINLNFLEDIQCK